MYYCFNVLKFLTLSSLSASIQFMLLGNDHIVYDNNIKIYYATDFSGRNGYQYLSHLTGKKYVYAF